ncbi:MAG: hypothetical protein HPY44_05805 [Armatimonadetes bacterium]|nr:hypothetical protein [Armatimonadota bacterium]
MTAVNCPGSLCRTMGVLVALGVSVPSTAQFFPGQPPGQAGQAPQLNLPVPNLTLPEVTDPFLILFPQLKDLPAPDWVREGLRITYYCTVATVRGNFVFDPLDGAARTTPDDPPGGSGDGFWQQDLVAVDGRTYAQHHVMYSLLANRQAPSPALTLMSMGIPGYGASWANPKAFENAEQLQAEGLRIAKMPYEVQGRKYDSVRIETTTSQGVGIERRPDGRFVSVFDLRTGLLLFSSTATYSPASDSTLLFHLEYRGQRMLNLPWQAGVTPNWVKQGGRMTLEGYTTMVMAGSPPVPLKTRAVIETRERGGRWSTHATSLSVGAAPGGPTTSVTGASQVFGGVWLPATALNALRQGLVLDQDPITGSRIVVNGVGTDVRDTPAIQITETCGQWSLTLGYDRRDGSLVSSYKQTPMPFSTLVEDLYRTGPPS